MARELQYIYLSVTTAAGGSGSATANIEIVGAVYAVEWIDGDFADGVDATLEVTGTPSGVDRTILTLTDANDDEMILLREQAQDNTSAAVAGVYELPPVVGKLKLSVTSGGDTKTGGAVVYYI